MNTEALRIVFAGTPEFAAQHLSALINAQYQICGVFTQPDKPAGRGQKVTPSPVKELALEHELPIYQPASLRTPNSRIIFKQLNPDLLIDVAYGLILPKEILEIPTQGCMNVHASLLPRWRGAAPIQRAILAGDQETGITIMEVDEGLDTGPILLQASCPIYDTDTSGELHDRLATLGTKTLLKALRLLSEDALHAEPQDNDQACYAEKITKEEAQIDWKQPAAEIHRQIRAFHPAPIAFTEIGGQRIRVWQATPLSSYTSENEGTIIRMSSEGLDVATGDGVLRLQNIQFPGGKVLPMSEILKSRKNFFEKNTCFDPQLHLVL